MVSSLQQHSIVWGILRNMSLEVMWLCKKYKFLSPKNVNLRFSDCVFLLMIQQLSKYNVFARSIFLHDTTMLEHWGTTFLHWNTNFLVLAELNITSLDPEATSKFVLHCIQLEDHMAYRSNEFYKFFHLQELGNNTYPFSVKGGLVLELVVAKWWASLGNTKITYSISFHSLDMNQKMIQMVLLSEIFFAFFAHTNLY